MLNKKLILAAFLITFSLTGCASNADFNSNQSVLSDTSQAGTAIDQTSGYEKPINETPIGGTSIAGAQTGGTQADGTQTDGTPANGTPAGLKQNGTNNTEIKQKDDSGFEIDGLVLLKSMDSDFVIDLRYATTGNFMKKAVYSVNVGVLRKETAKKLVNANKEFKKMGYCLKIWDAYRPLSVQKKLWEVVSDSRFVADPSKGSNHNRGAAVDVTLVDKNGNELKMPTGFDNFTEKASRNYKGMTAEERNNLKILTDTMVKSGFKAISYEWWHFNDTDAKNYPVMDISLEEFVR